MSLDKDGSAAESPMAPDHGDAFSPSEGPVERCCRWLCSLLIVVAVLMSVTDIVGRNLGSPIAVTNELGGYILLAITFFSVAPCQVRHAFHRFQVLDTRLSPRRRAWLQMVFDSLCTIGVAIFLWQFVRFAFASLQSGEVAPTNLTTPLWIPRSVMVFGAAALLWSMLRTLRGDFRRLDAI